MHSLLGSLARLVVLPEKTLLLPRVLRLLRGQRRQELSLLSIHAQLLLSVEFGRSRGGETLLVRHYSEVGRLHHWRLHRLHHLRGGSGHVTGILQLLRPEYFAWAHLDLLLAGFIQHFVVKVLGGGNPVVVIKLEASIANFVRFELVASKPLVILWHAQIVADVSAQL